MKRIRYLAAVSGKVYPILIRGIPLSLDAVTFHTSDRNENFRGVGDSDTKLKNEIFQFGFHYFEMKKNIFDATNHEYFIESSLVNCGYLEEWYEQVGHLLPSHNTEDCCGPQWVVFLYYEQQDLRSLCSDRWDKIGNTVRSSLSSFSFVPGHSRVALL